MSQGDNNTKQWLKTDERQYAMGLQYKTKNPALGGGLRLVPKQKVYNDNGRHNELQNIPFNQNYKTYKTTKNRGSLLGTGETMGWG